VRKLPFKLPSAYALLPGQAAVVPDIDTGGYDFMIDGHGFRLATDQQMPYQRETEPTTTHRYDSSQEPGEQSLSALPWIKSQSSFHGGAGQLNLESALTQFQYQQEQVEHIRYDTSLGLDPWTPGKVKRLPDVQRYAFGFDSKQVCTATVAGVDYAIIGGTNSLYQVAWSSGPDAAPTITAIDLSSATFGGMSNCTVGSLSTDGTNYYAVLQLTAVGSTPGILTYIISGQVTSALAPAALYEVPNYTAYSPRTNICVNPSFETNTSSWSAEVGASVATSVTQHQNRAQSMKVTATGGGSIFSGVHLGFTAVIGKTYTCSAYVYLDASMAGSNVLAAVQEATGTFGSSTTVTGVWTRISVTFTAQTTSPAFAVWCGAANFTAGKFYYTDAVLIEQAGGVGTYFDGASAADSQYTYGWSGTADASTSVATPIVVPQQAPGICGWVKERLIGALSNSVYELPVNVAAHTALPTAKYTHPIASYMWSAISESPVAILLAGASGLQSSITKFALDTNGNTPTLGGGATIAVLPPGEKVLCLQAYLGSFLAIGTNYGVRIGTFDTYTGNMTYGPLSLTTTAAVNAVTGRDRFIFAGYTNQQPDGKTGLARLDLSTQVDTAGRVAWAPDLRPPTSAPTGLGAVTAVAVLPNSLRLVFLTPEGIHVEGNGPGNDGSAWLRTSRIRYDTAEPKLFKLGRVRGSLDSSTISIVGSAPYQSDSNLATLGFVTGSDPGEFRLPSGLNEWVQLRFILNGSTCILNSYQVKALPAPKRQHVITLTANCFSQETDKYGLAVTDPETPRSRYQNLKDVEAVGNEVRFVEFTNTGAVAELVVIDQLAFQSFSRPNIEDDFGGYITLKLRTTES